MTEPVPIGRWWGDHLAETRWILEATRLRVDPVFLGRDIPRGDGRGVVLVPGFGGGDYTLATLASWLRRMGYRPAVCGFVLNADCSERSLERVERRVAALHARTGRRVAVIGHSRGGHFARAAAARRPELVSHAISLGADLQEMFHCSAPILAAVEGTRRVLLTTGRARQPECVTSHCPCSFTAAFRAPFPTDRVRFTSVYSKQDGVVRWQAQLVPDADCVEVTGSHVGLIFNRQSYRVIAEALAAPEVMPSR
ncbi:alpha/beta hydrolase [Solirubrobacter ginsenosidimutans]|uniref:Alpha/beta hydrolase n=1 Tax=Solirubrobacter ginsenosidimutans TaxID=490573 RepID=A0A9X3N1V0_9ACTN|nr:alpha/beta fold hydrolase [Solirubrobacter ginsenosidimutans]MDA0166840.1 alpha/beta hydrolase [Solirubrobacter ginsenosidimutans]